MQEKTACPTGWRHGIEEIPHFVWIGLIWEDETLTLEHVENLIEDAIPDKYTVIGIVDTVVEAIADQVGVKKKAVTKTKKRTPSKVTVRSRSKSGSHRKKNSKT